MTDAQIIELLNQMQLQYFHQAASLNDIRPSLEKIFCELRQRSQKNAVPNR
jgi:hypothetical protein